MKELELLIQKAKRYDWLMSNGRDDNIWYNVLSDEDRELDDFMDECIDKAIMRDSK
mgnify:CR=1 FL=1